MKGIFIRAAIRYLSELSSKNLSNQLLVDEGILDPTVLQGSAHEEMVTIANYRSRIEEATRLLNSWVRKLRPGEGSFPGIDRPRRPLGYTAGFETPIADSTLPPGITAAMLAVMGDMGINYRIDRVPKTMPPVLAQLKLEGLHHYVAHPGELTYKKSMEVVAFLNKAVREVDFSEDDGWFSYPEEPHFLEKLKNILGACLVDNVITIG